MQNNHKKLMRQFQEMDEYKHGQKQTSELIVHIWKKSEKTNETNPRNACYKHPDKQISEIYKTYLARVRCPIKLTIYVIILHRHRSIPSCP